MKAEVENGVNGTATGGGVADREEARIPVAETGELRLERRAWRTAIRS